MASLGLILALVGGLMLPIGVFLFNKYSGKARNENHNEIVKNQGELGNRIDSTKKDIINEIGKKVNDRKSVQENLENKMDKNQEMSNSSSETKNQIINNAPNQGVQINENNGTVIVPKPLARNFSISDARKILQNYPTDYPIEIWLKGTTNESKAFFDQVLSSFQSLGCNKISTTTIGMFVDGNKIEKDFQYSFVNDKLIVSIFPQQ